MIDAGTAATAYLDMMALLLLTGLIVLGRTRRSGRIEGMLFTFMSMMTVVMCVSDIVYCAMVGRGSEAAHMAAMIAETLVVYAIFSLVYTWVLYVDYRIYTSTDHLLRHFKPFAIPLIILAICLLINPFTGIVFTIDDDWCMRKTWLFYLIMLVECVYFIGSVVMLYHQSKKENKTVYIHVDAMVIPALAGEAVSMLTPHHATPIGIAVGLTFLYCALIDKWRFHDENEMIYNRAYLRQMLKQIREKRRDYRCAVLFMIDRNGEVLRGILEEENPYEGVIVRLDDRRFVLFIEKNSAAAVKLLCTGVEEAIAGYNAQHGEAMRVEHEVIGRREGVRTWLAKHSNL